MATSSSSSNSRDVKMTLSVETLGAEGIQKLQADVAGLAKKGGEAAPEFQKLADEIGRLGEQSAALQQFQQLADATGELSARQAQAAATAAELKLKLDALTANTQEAVARQQALAVEQATAVARAKELRDEYDLLSATTDRAGKKANEYKDSIQRLKVAKIEQRAEVERLGAALSSATDDVKRAESAEVALAVAHKRLVDTAAQATGALRANTASVQQAADAAREMGVSTENVATAQAELVQGLNAAGRAAQVLSTQVDALAATERTLAALKPFEKLADEAQQLVAAGNAVSVFDQALAELTVRKRQVAAQDDTADWQKEAAAIVDAAEAVQRLTRQTELLVATERELKAQAAFEQQAQDARALVQAGEYVRFWREELDKAEQQAQQTADAAKLVTAAFKTIGLSNAQAIEADIAKVRAAMETLRASTANIGGALTGAFAAGDAKVRELELELAKLTTSLTAADAAADVFGDAFKTLNTRSVQALQAEIVQVRAAMDTLRNSAANTGGALTGAFTAGEAKVAALEREIRQMSGTLTTADRAANLFSNSLGQISAGNVVADAVGYLVEKVKALGVAFLGAIVDGDQLRRGLNAIYKDAGVTASQIDFLRRSSSESGVAFGTLSQEFVKFSASMKSANIPLAQSNDLFRAVTAATSSLGLGTEATSGTLNALGQIASKGTVSLEELRQQLGDRLPGAMGLTAKGLGITEAQLIKLVESGGLAARDFIVPFTKALAELQGETDGLVPTFDRFKGTLTEVAQGMGDAGATNLLTGALKVLGGLVGNIALGLSVLFEITMSQSKALGILAGSIVTLTNPMDALKAVLSESTDRLTKQANALNTFIDGADGASSATTAHAVAMTVNTAEVIKALNANTSLSAVQKVSTLSTVLAADATLDASAKIVQYTVASGELLKQQQAQSEAYEKLAKAAKQQGDTLVDLAKLTGDATTIQRASVVAAELNAAAQVKLAASQAAETVILVAQKTELEASAKARGLSAEQIKVQIDTLDKLIVKSQAETEQAAQANAAAKAALFERNLAVEALKNHAAQIDTFKQAMDAATLTLKEYERLALEGKKTDDEVAAARLALTRATVLYKDAVADSIAALDLETRAKQAGVQLSIAQSTTAQKHSEVLAAQARALGDTTTATLYDIQAREQSIVTIKLQMQMAALEAEAALKTIELKRLETDGTTEQGKRKLAILDIEAALIKVKLAGNEVAKETIKGIENEIAGLRNGTIALGANTGARGGSSEAMQSQADALDLLATKFKLSVEYTERETAALDRLTAASERARAAENKRLNRDSEKFSIDPATGKRIEALVNTRASVAANAKSQGLTDAQAEQIARYFITERGEMVNYNPGGRLGAGQGETFSSVVQKAIAAQVKKSAAAGDASSSALAEVDSVAKAQAANLQGQRSESELSKRQLEARAEQARLQGDVANTTRFENEVRLQSVETLEIELRMRELETQAALKAIALRRTEVTGSDEASARKRVSLDTEAAQVRAKITDNAQLQSQINSLLNQVDAANAKSLNPTKQITKYNLLDGTKQVTTTGPEGKTLIKTNSDGDVLKASTTVNIVIGGVSRPVTVSSAADATNLTSILRQLADAQGRSSL